MSRFSPRFAALTCGIVVAASPALAGPGQDHAHKAGKDKGAHMAQKGMKDNMLFKLCRASHLIGKEVVSSMDQENLGEVQDLILSADRVRVEAARISSGGFLGMGEDYAVVPLSSIIFPAQKDFPLHINATWVEGAKNTANEWRLAGDWESYDYAGQGYQENWAWGYSARDTTRYEGRLVSNLLNMTVRNFEDVDLGEIEEIILEERDGRLVYAWLSTGGLADLMDLDLSYTLVPWSKISINWTEGSARLNAELEVLQANATEEIDLEQLRNRDYAGRMHASFQTPPYWDAPDYSVGVDAGVNVGGTRMGVDAGMGVNAGNGQMGVQGGMGANVGDNRAGVQGGVGGTASNGQAGVQGSAGANVGDAGVQGNVGASAGSNANNNNRNNNQRR
jgi:sporulation protein YlmC with PRC-barrel domain